MPAYQPPEERKRPTGPAPTLRHNIHIDKRESITVAGVTDVISFDEESVICETEMGVLVLSGANLHVKRINLESGELAVTGEIDGIRYEEASSGTKAKSLFGRMFK